MRSETDLIRAYLLGHLNDDERMAFEHRIFSDEAFFDRVEHAEDELIDEYVFGRMPEDRRTAFECHFLQSPGRKSRVATARALKAHLSTAPQNEERFSWVALVRGRFTGQSPLQRFALIACGLIMFAVLSMWLVERERQTAQVADNAKRVAPESKPPLKHPEEAPPATVMPRIAAFVLTPGVLRDAGDKVLRFRPDIDRVRLTLRSSVELTPGTYKVVIELEDHSRTIWSGPASEEKNTNQRVEMLSVFVPGAVLRQGNYVLTVSECRRGGSCDALEDYAFRVEHSR
jgi:anti-sigma factor RsiW